jgi:hypothetical protein
VHGRLFQRPAAQAFHRQGIFPVDKAAVNRLHFDLYFPPQYLNIVAGVEILRPGGTGDKREEKKQQKNHGSSLGREGRRPQRETGGLYGGFAAVFGEFCDGAYDGFYGAPAFFTAPSKRFFAMSK